MKTLSILLLALSFTTACALDEAPRSGTPGRPAHKPLVDIVNSDVGLTEIATDVDEVDSGSDAPLILDPRDANGLEGERPLPAWAEEVIINGEPRTVLVHRNGRKELLVD